ncbi:uncharacterized protein LOC134945852 isoform X3 [Pseudophryne corroboree]|uniref:uncharacterized protein LOC134945852 isoform X3 n=1 Tax=Pseudophryne corroboree TaxID=495146 RepID=UPI003081ADCC
MQHSAPVTVQPQQCPRAGYISRNPGVLKMGIGPQGHHSVVTRPRTFFQFLLRMQGTCSAPGAALELTVPQTHKATMGSDVQIPCSFKVNRPPVIRKDLQIVWKFQGKEILSVQGTTVTRADTRLSYIDRTMEGGANLAITNVTLSDGGMYTCSVRYGADRNEREIRLDIQAPPRIRITDKAVLTDKQSVLHSTITGFYPEDIDIKWLRDGEILNAVTVGKLLRHPDGTFSVNSSVMITPTKEDRERIFSCRIQHQSLNGPLQEAFKLVYGAVPSIYITSKVFEMHVEQTLVCHVSGFYPESIAVNWLLNGTLVENTKTQNIGSSSVESVYQFLPTDENWGKELTCMVEHGTLILPLTERLLVEGRDLRVKHKPYVIVTAVVLAGVLVSVIIATLLIRYRKKRLPKVRNIMCSTDGAFSVNVDHFYPEDISIDWTVIQPPLGSKDLESNPIIMQKNQDGTFNATSTCESVRDKVNVDEPYTVRAEVTHEKLKHPIQKEWKSQESNIKHFLSRPVMGDIQTPDLLLEKQAKLQCTISRYYPDSLTVMWYKKERGSMALIPIHDSDTSRSPARRSQPQSDKTFTYTACLLLTPSLQDQGAEYICRAKHPSLEQPLERSTGALQVQVKPKLQQPVQLSISDSGKLVGSLSLLNFYPKDIRVTWSSGPAKNMQSEEAVSENSDGTFTITTKCNIPVTATPATVTWQHGTMEAPDHREVSVRDPDFPWRPRIEDMTPLILQKDTPTTVSCTVSAYFPNDLRVTWLEKRKGRGETDCASNNWVYTIPPINPVKQADNSCTCSPVLSLRPTSYSDDLEYICRVEHPSLEKPIEQSTGPARVNVPPQVGDGVKLTLCAPDRVLCSLSLVKFYPQNIDITWTRGSRTLPSTKKVIQTNDEKMFDAISECTVPWDYLSSQVRVTWSHESLTGQQERDVDKKDFPWRPVIEEAETPPLLVNTEVRLQYRISGYFPDDLTVTWYKKESRGLVSVNNIHNISVSNTGRQQQPDNTYSCTACLLFTPLQIEDEGSEFICRVEHSSLEQPLERSTGVLHVQMAPEVIEPVRFSLCDSGQVLCSLTLRRFYPNTINITWASGDQRQYIRSQNSVTESGSGKTFDARSECTLPRGFQPPVCVTWEHKSLPQPLHTVLTATDLPWRPHVGDIDASNLIQDSVSELRCTISGYFPDDLTVSWCKKEKGGWTFNPLSASDQYKMPAIQSQRQPDNTYSCTAILTPSPGDRGSEFLCRVEHPSLETPIERSSGALQVKEPPTPTDVSCCLHVGDIDASNLIQDRESTLRCPISGYFPDALTVSWCKKDGPWSYKALSPGDQYKMSVTPSQRQPDGTYSCTASLVFTPSAKDRWLEFLCKVKHPSLDRPIQRKTGALQVKVQPTPTGLPKKYECPHHCRDLSLVNSRDDTLKKKRHLGQNRDLSKYTPQSRNCARGDGHTSGEGNTQIVVRITPAHI